MLKSRKRLILVTCSGITNMIAKSKKIVKKEKLSKLIVIPREQWDKQFKMAIKQDDKPDNAMPEFSNQFDKEEWTW